ncbi:hypothetical protein HAX54_022749 [Datura stramonium]|uniref:E3 ubiquitin-protein ligase n=1 Tax=Datura stramonium TaxID=4076 RepID=A0ABS8S4A3_DATST|nr:hypothetical protein [Datura stramonium]
MFRMEIDSSSDSYTLTPMDRILQRLDSLGVPAENLEQLQPGLVAYVKNNKSQMGELVSALLPTNEEAMEVIIEQQIESPKSTVSSSVNVKDLFQESMDWIQWLMFDGEPSRALEQLADTGQRGVCGAVWGNNDIAYRCRTCEHDPTCAICVPCFQNGNHKDHDYSIIYTGGGCCDCGDVTAWKREGFCSKHRGAEQIQPLPEEFANSMGPVLDLLLSCWTKRLLFPESISGKNPRRNDHSTELKTVIDELTSAVVEMLLKFCKHSESLLSFISRRVSSSAGLLDILVRAERFMITEENVKKIHELLLKLLGEPQFKYEFAKVFLCYYPTVVNEATRACSDTVFNKYPLLSTFSVQIFTVPTLTPRLVKEMNLLPMLLGCLGDILVSCAGEDGKLQVMPLEYSKRVFFLKYEDLKKDPILNAKRLAEFLGDPFSLDFGIWVLFECWERGCDGWGTEACGCRFPSGREDTSLVNVIGLPEHLWCYDLFTKIGDVCGGFCGCYLHRALGGHPNRRSDALAFIFNRDLHSASPRGSNSRLDNLARPRSVVRNETEHQILGSKPADVSVGWSSGFGNLESGRDAVEGGGVGMVVLRKRSQAHNIVLHDDDGRQETGDARPETPQSRHFSLPQDHNITIQNGLFSSHFLFLFCFLVCQCRGLVTPTSLLPSFASLC